MDTSVGNLGFIGTGAIAQAVIAGLIDHGGFRKPIFVSERSQVRSSKLAERFDNVRVEAENQRIVDQSDLMFISVLPDQAREVLLRLAFRKEQTLVSLVAGISLQELEQVVSPAHKIVRMIPLPPIENGVGPLPVCPPDRRIRELFSECAHIIEVENEDQFSAFSAASGLMAPHHQFTASIAEWLVTQGIDASNAAGYASNMIHALASIEAATPADQLSGLADESTTAGGLNEQALRELKEIRWFDQLQTRLDRLADRLGR